MIPIESRFVGWVAGGALFGSMMADVFGGIGGLVAGAVLGYAAYSADDRVEKWVSGTGKEIEAWKVSCSRCDSGAAFLHEEYTDTFKRNHPHSVEKKPLVECVKDSDSGGTE